MYRYMILAFIRISCFHRGVCAFGIGILALVLAGTASANTLTITASERGWVCVGEFGGTCDANNGTSPVGSYQAGAFTAGSFTQVDVFRDWFQFAIPTWAGGSLVSATLNLDEPSTGHLATIFVPTTFAVYGLGARPLVFTDVTTSNPFGSIATSLASNGTTLAITLNASALAAISANQGGFIYIGGVDSAETSPEGYDFRDTQNAVSSLTLTTTAPATVPEPSSMLLLVSAALLASGWKARRAARRETARRSFRVMTAHNLEQPTAMV